jgi:2-keto-4-pentenoate hydratase/2-oxohepta-3-ene-1,7-dioic acid hydratase in catechol pathway
VRHSLANGDLIFTGTPEGIGALTNRCVRINDHRVC